MNNYVPNFINICTHIRFYRISKKEKINIPVNNFIVYHVVLSLSFTRCTSSGSLYTIQRALSYGKSLLKEKEDHFRKLLAFSEDICYYIAGL